MPTIPPPKNAPKGAGKAKKGDYAGDSIEVLAGGGLHPEALAHLRESRKLIDRASDAFFGRRRFTRQAIEEQEKARALMIEGRS